MFKKRGRVRNKGRICGVETDLEVEMMVKVCCTLDDGKQDITGWRQGSVS